MKKADPVSPLIPQFSYLCNRLSHLLAGNNFLQTFRNAYLTFEQNKINRPISLISRSLTRLETLYSALMPKGATWVLHISITAPLRAFYSSISSRYTSEDFFSIIPFIYNQLSLWSFPPSPSGQCL